MLAIITIYGGTYVHCPLRGVKDVEAPSPALLRSRPPPPGSSPENLLVRMRIVPRRLPLRRSTMGGREPEVGLSLLPGARLQLRKSRARQLEAGEAAPLCFVLRASRRSWTPRRWNERCARMWFPPYGTSSSMWPCCESVSVLPGCNRETSRELPTPITQLWSYGLWGLLSWAERSQGARGRRVGGSGRLRVCGSEWGYWAARGGGYYVVNRPASPCLKSIWIRLTRVITQSSFLVLQAETEICSRGMAGSRSLSNAAYDLDLESRPLNAIHDSLLHCWPL